MANAFVQKCSVLAANSTSPLVLTNGAVATTAGNLLVVLFTAANKNAASSVTDSAGNTYTKAVSINAAATWWTSEIWYCANAAAVAATTGTWSIAHPAGSIDRGGIVLEYSGLGATPAVSTTGTVDQSSSAAGWTVTSGGSATAGDLVVAMAACDSGTFTAPGGYNSRNTAMGGGNGTTGAADILSASSGSQSAAFTVSPNKDGSGAIACFTPSGGGATTNKTLSVTSTVTASMVRSVGKPLAVTSALTATMIRSIGKPLARTVTTTATMIRSIGKPLSVTSTLTATMVRSIGKPLARTVTTTASMVRSVGKTLSVTSATTATLTASRAFLRTLASTVTTASTMVRSVGKVVSVTSTTTVSIARVVAYLRTLAVTSTVTASVVKSISKTLSAISSLAASLVATFQGASGPADIGTADLANEATATATLDDALVNSATMTHAALGSATLDVVLVNP